MKLLFLSGSSQVGSANWRLATTAADLAKRSFPDRIDPVLIDLLQFDLPNYEQGTPDTGIPADAERLRRFFDDVSGVFMSSDEYTGAYSAILKNAIGWLHLIDPNQSTPFRGMDVALCATASRGAGGLRGQPAMQQMLGELGASVMTQTLELGTSESAFDRDGRLIPKAERQLLAGSLGKLCARMLEAKAGA